MSFQAYVDNIKVKTGKTPEDFRDAAQAKGLLAPGTKATQIVEWLKQDYDLGRGHAMCIWAVFQQNSWIEPGPGNGKTGK
jgi:hypothetical protein